MSEVAKVDVRVVPDAQSAHIRLLEQMLRLSGREFLSQSPAMTQILEQVVRMAETDIAVLNDLNDSRCGSSCFYCSAFICVHLRIIS